MNEDKSAWVKTYTTAPVDYDWFGTHTLRIVAKNKKGQEIREVLSDPAHVKAQRQRYGSGLHLAVEETEYDKLVAYKLVEVLP